MVALAKVESITGQRPSLAVLKPELKPAALTADVLNLTSHDVEPEQPDVVKTATVPTLIVQSQVIVHPLVSFTLLCISVTVTVVFIIVIVRRVNAMSVIILQKCAA